MEKINHKKAWNICSRLFYVQGGLLAGVLVIGRSHITLAEY